MGRIPYQRFDSWDEPDESENIYSILLDSLAEDIENSYIRYLRNNTTRGLGDSGAITVYDSEIGEIVSCENSFVHFVLERTLNLLDRMRNSLSSRAVCELLAHDLSFVCKTFVEKRLSTRPRYDLLNLHNRDGATQKLISDSEIHNIQTHLPLKAIVSRNRDFYDFSPRDKVLFKNLFMENSVSSFFQNYALEGSYFGVGDELTITFTDDVLEYWYPNCNLLFKEASTSHKSFVMEETVKFWIACTLSIEACFSKRQVFQELINYVRPDLGG